MTVGACLACNDLRIAYEIGTRGQLTKAIRVVRANLADGTLVDITQSAHSPSGKFADLSESGPWPDYIEHYFQCKACGHRFRFSAETYHGAGGEWEPYVSAP